MNIFLLTKKYIKYKEQRNISIRLLIYTRKCIKKKLKKIYKPIIKPLICVANHQNKSLIYLSCKL